MTSIRRTKIVATLGPATDDRKILKQLIQAGVDVVRLNFSHGNAEDHQQRATLVGELAAARSPIRTKTAYWCRRRKLPPMTCNRK